MVELQRRLQGLVWRESPSQFPAVLLFQTLITFVNKHLNKLNLEVTELETQVSDSPGCRVAGQGPADSPIPPLPAGLSS